MHDLIGPGGLTGWLTLLQAGGQIAAALGLGMRYVTGRIHEVALGPAGSPGVCRASSSCLFPFAVNTCWDTAYGISAGLSRENFPE